MPAQYLEQVIEILRACGSNDGVLLVDREGVICYQHLELSYFWKKGETVGRRIQELYPELTEETSTILRALHLGEATYDLRQELVSSRGERVVLDATTIPIVVDGRVEGAVDYSRFYVVGQRIIRGGRRDGLSTLDSIVTRDPAMLTLKRRIRDVARTDSSVLIYGETGTGKELVAESLHSESERGGKPFVSQNCAAIPHNLLESIFFGTEKGSYTGAVDRKGLFELANGGTLFLDEINSMDISLQVKLLKAIEEKKVRHLGGTRDIQFDVRIVAAVNEEPMELIRTKRMREDLYYRLGVIRLNLPPLRERPADIGLLAGYFIERYNHKRKRAIRGISPQALRRLEQYQWPGNIRELQNVIEGAFVSARGDLLEEEDITDILETRREGREPETPGFPEVTARITREESLPRGEISLTREVERYEKELIRQAMDRWGSISAAARHLGLSRQNLKYKLQKYNL